MVTQTCACSLLAITCRMVIQKWSHIMFRYVYYVYHFPPKCSLPWVAKWQGMRNGTSIITPICHFACCSFLAIVLIENGPLKCGIVSKSGPLNNAATLHSDHYEKSQIYWGHLSIHFGWCQLRVVRFEGVHCSLRLYTKVPRRLCHLKNHPYPSCYIIPQSQGYKSNSKTSTMSAIFMGLLDVFCMISLIPGPSLKFSAIYWEGYCVMWFRVELSHKKTGPQVLVALILASLTNTME